jgi:hypothetical protein
MNHPSGAESGARRETTSRVPLVVGLALTSLALHAALALAGDLRNRLALYWAAHAILTVCMLAAWRGLGRDPACRRWVVGAALAFRLVAVLGQPALSDDVYRYVWDGRVQAHGIDPYRYAPVAPELAELRDEVWAAINHPELKTIYPPLAQLAFGALALAGAGPTGFRLALGLADFGVVLALGALLRRARLPADRVILYAWNPLAVIESGGSGHVEPLGVALVVLAAGWIIDRRPGLSTLALAGAVQAKLLPLALVPCWLRRLRAREIALFGATLALLALPYLAWGGNVLGRGLVDYAERWERNAFLYAGVERLLAGLDAAPLLKAGLDALRARVGEGLLPWDFLYRHVWPPELARAVVLAAALGWIVWLAFRPGLDAARETFLALAGVLLLAPTLHPWYVLWVLPFAAAFRSRGWLLFAALVPLAYAGGAADVPWTVRAIEYLPPLGLLLWDAFSRRRVW